MRVLQSIHLQGCLHFFTTRRGCRSPIYPLCQPVSNGNAAFSGLNMHCGGQPCLLCPLVIPSGDSTQSYHIKHTAEGKKEAWKEKPRFSQSEGSSKHGKPFSWKMKVNETELQYSGWQTGATASQTPQASQLQLVLALIPLPTEPSSKEKHHLDGHLENKILILVREKSLVFSCYSNPLPSYPHVFLPAGAGSEITWAGFLPQVTVMDPM